MAKLNVIVAGGTHLDRFLRRAGETQSEPRDHLGGAAHTAYMIERLYRGERDSLDTYLYDYPISAFGAVPTDLKHYFQLIPICLDRYEQRHGAKDKTSRIKTIFDAYHIPIGAKEQVQVQKVVWQKSSTSPGTLKFDKCEQPPALPWIVVLMENCPAYPDTVENDNINESYYKDIAATLINSGDNWYVWAPRLARNSTSRLLQLYAGRHAEKSVLILTAGGLRELGFPFRGDKSLENNARVFFECFDRLKSVLKERCLPAHLIVMFENIGALYYRKAGSTKAVVSYCPFFDSPEEYYPDKFGRMRGYRTYMIACIVKSMVYSQKLDGAFDGLRDGIQHGVIFGKVHYHEGVSEGQNIKVESPGNQKVYCHPVAKSIDELLQDTPTGTTYNELVKADYKRLLKKNDYSDLLPFASVEVKVRIVRVDDTDTGRVEVTNRINYLAAKLKKGKLKVPDDAMDRYALGIVKHGLKAMARVSFEEVTRCLETGEKPSSAEAQAICLPYASFGDIQTVDCAEIDGFRTMRALIERYEEDRNWRERPLCIAVFGAPGAGKGFTVKQILKDVNVWKKDSKALEINLSQLPDSETLFEAFHEVQDRALMEDLPLVTLDEFDSDFPSGRKPELGWLKFFLSPMQDGTFVRKGKTYHIGNAIFLFSGGVHYSFRDFADKVAGELDPSVKAVDFLSRIRGYLNISSVNPERDDHVVTDDLLLRRAIVLRSVLERKPSRVISDASKEARVDNAVIYGFLKAKGFRHGVRSIEAIVDTATLYDNKFLVASLPPEDQLGMHVDAAHFLKVVNEQSAKSRE